MSTTTYATIERTLRAVQPTHAKYAAVQLLFGLEPELRNQIYSMILKLLNPDRELGLIPGMGVLMAFEVVAKTLNYQRKQIAP